MWQKNRKKSDSSFDKNFKKKMIIVGYKSREKKPNERKLGAILVRFQYC